jgi:2-amino-4-hydroxy-6-hydroxymethyldihydropteridine diphosphokinase
MGFNKLFKNITKKVFGGGKPMKKKNKKMKAKKAVKRSKPVKKSKPKKADKKKIAAAKKAPVMKKASKPAAVKAEKQKLKVKKGPIRVFIGLGSNVGDREEYIEQGIFLLSKTPGIKIIKKSANYETDAEGPGDQPAYLNAVVEIQTAIDPYKLLEILHETENALGREREVEWGPRTIDLDMLLYDDLIISDDKLQVPHPLLHERIFVLRPLAEIAPKAIHPALERTIESLFEERKTDAGDKYDDDLPGFKDIKKGVADDYERW